MAGKNKVEVLLTARDQASAKVHGLAGALTSLKGIAVTAFAGWGAVELSKQFIQTADALTLVSGRLSLVTEGTADLARVQEKLFNVANQTRVAYQGTADLYARIARSTKELGISQEDLIQTTKTINQALIVSGASAIEASAALIQLSQGLASGALRGDELRSVLEQTPRLARAMAEGLGVGIGQLRELGTAGELTAEKVISSLLSQKDVIEKEFGKMPVTVGQAMTILNNEIGLFISGADNATSLTAKMAGGIRNFANAIHEIDTKVFSDMADTISALWDVMIATPEGFIDFFRRSKEEIDTTTNAINEQKTSYENIVNYMSWLGETMLAAFVFMGKELGSFLAWQLSAIIAFVKDSGKWLKAWYDLAVGVFSFDKEKIAAAWDTLEPHKAVERTLKKLQDLENRFRKESKEAWDEYLKVYGQIPDLVEPIKRANKELVTSNKSVGDSFGKIDEKALAAYQKILNFLKVHTLADEATRRIEQLRQEYAAIEKQLVSLWKQSKITDEQILEGMHQLAIGYENDLALMADATEESTDQIYDLWQHTYEKMTDVLADFFRTGKFHISNFTDFFLDQLSQIGAAWVMGNQAKSGFSFANMFGGVFGGGGGAQPGTSGIQQGIQGASSAWSLNQAYGAYTTAGGGWGGLRAGTGSFFGMGGGAAGAAPAANWSLVGGIPTATAPAATATAGSGIGATLSAIPWTWWAAAIVVAADYFAKLNVKKGYGLVEGTPQGLRAPYQPTNAFGLDFATDPFGTWLTGTLGFDEPMAGNYLDAAIARSDWGTALKALPATILEWSSPVLTLLGKWAGIDMGKIFGFSNKKRSYYGKEFEYGDYSPDTGWGESIGTQYRDKRKGKKVFGEAGEAMAETALGLMNSLDSLFKGLLGTFGETWASQFTTGSLGLAAGKPSFDFYISAEDKGEFEDDWRKSWKEMTKNLINPIVDLGTDLLSQALNSTVTDAPAWKYFSDEMQEYLKEGLMEGLEGLKIDWSTVTDQKSFEAALEGMGLAVEQIANIVAYFTEVGTILEHITTTIDMHGFSDSVKGAISNLSSIKAEFLGLAATLVSAGIDLEKYTDLQKAYNIAIQDWINQAFVGAISYASTSQDWQAMAPQATSSTDMWIGQYQHVQDLAAAHDGTTASAIELSDALGILSGLSYDLAAEMQSAIASIHESYTSAIESMYLETLTGQGKYDYYKAQASASYDLMMSATSVEAIRAYAADILQYSQGAYGMMSNEQKQQYFSQYQDFLLNVETASTDRINDLGDAMDTANEKLIKKLTPLIVGMVTDIQNAAVLISSGGADVAAGGADILDASGTPITVNVNLDTGEVG